jgi:hypothetical protein
VQPIDFPEKTKDLLKPEGMTDPQCGSLPVWSDNAVCVSCWRPSLRERLSMLWFGKVWLHVHAGRTQPPIALEGKRQIFTRVEE